MLRMVVPHKATDPSCVTVVHATEQIWTAATGADGVSRIVRRPLRLAKLISAAGIKEYDHVQLVHPSAWKLDCVEDFPELLTLLEPQASACVIRGALKPAFADRAEVYRRCAAHHGDLAMFSPAARQWLMIDAEDIPCPPGVDPKDPELAGGAARRALPSEFRSARAVVQLSSGAGIKPGLRTHLWFWLSRPVSDDEARRWLKGAPVDLAVFNPVQPHYCARPIFEGVDDPCVDGRLAVLAGHDEVVVPGWPEPVFAPGAGCAGRAGAVRAGGAGHWFDWQSAERKLVLVGAMLAALPAGAFPDRDPHSERSWFRIMCSVHDGLGGSAGAWGIFDAWSRERAGGHYDQAENRRAWCSLGAGDGGGQITIGTLLALAQLHGWRPPPDVHHVPVPDARELLARFLQQHGI